MEVSAARGQSAAPSRRPESRVERKERTRRAILDAALDLSADVGLAGLSLRQVAKQVGIVPTAFYRHFGSVEELGLALVEESFGSLRAVLRDVRRGEPPLGEVVERSVDVLDQHVHADAPHYIFIARERGGGNAHVRAAVQREFELFERELAADLARLPMPDWSAADLATLSNLIVSAMIATAESLLRAEETDREQIRRRARTQLDMVIVGARRWRSQR